MNFGSEQPTSVVSQGGPVGADDGGAGGLADWRANNEHVEMLREFVKPSTNPIFDDFLAKSTLTPRAINKLRNFNQLTIHPLLVSGNIPTEKDEAVLVGIFNVAMAMLPLGLVKFDINPEFHQNVQLNRLHFINQLQKARKGRTFSALTANRSEVYQYEGAVQPARRGFLQSFGILGGR